MDALLPDIWFFLLGLILFIYVLLDGLALGVGILSLGYRDEDQRSLLLGSIAPVWHAGQTWLIVLAGLLFGAFPLAYGLIFSALYLPVFLMLLGLIFRAVSLEFREEARSPKAWSLACGWGSLLAALAQGLVLGSLLSGLSAAGESFTGSVWDWLQPFPVLAAGGLVFGYALLGAAYLVLKTAGDIQRRSLRQARGAAVVALSALLILSAAAYFRFPHLQPARLWVPLLFAAIFIFITAGLLQSLGKRREQAPFLWSAALFLAGFAALAAGLYPHIVPPGVTINGAAAPGLTLKIMLAVMAPLLPVILVYNAYQHWVFRGKTKGGGYGYEEEGGKG